MPRKSKRRICDVHDEMCEIALDVEAEIDDLIPLKKDKRHIINKLHKIIADSKEAKQYGQDMEDRLKVYRNSIENIGFKRKKS